MICLPSRKDLAILVVVCCTNTGLPMGCAGMDANGVREWGGCALRHHAK